MAMGTLFRALAALALSGTVLAGTTTSVSNWGDNPSKLPAMLVYTPSTIAAKPAIILALHPCGGSGQQYQSSMPLNSYADRLGLIVLYPTSNVEDGLNCWDCFSNKSLTHNGGGDSEGLAGMVTWALSKYNGDASKVFVIGSSSGAMQANVVAGTYPELFNAAVSYSGVPDGCFIGSKSSSPSSADPTCANGGKHFSAQQWGDLARQSYPGYNGTRPRMMIVHGTADNVVNIALLKQQLDQWSNVLGLSFTKNITNDPTSNWKRIVYGDGTKLVGFEVQGGGHIPPFQADATFKWWGLI